MLDWESISPDDFEKICHSFLKEKYSSFEINKYSVSELIKKTQATHDGGRDIEIQYTVMGQETKIWAECKKYRNKIDLNTLGKHLVLVYNNNVHKFIVFSVSEIQKHSETAMIKFLKRLNIGIEIYAGVSLLRELSKYPHILEPYVVKPFPTSHFKFDPQYISTVQLDEYDENYRKTIPTPYRLCKDGAFRISVVIKNHHDVNMYILSAACKEEDTDFDIFTDDIEESVLLPANGATVFVFAFKSRTTRKIVSLPPMLLKYKLGEDDNILTGKIELGAVNFCQIHMSPLVGEDRKKIIAIARERLIDAKEKDLPVFFDIRGKGGTGKTRLMKEIIGSSRQFGIKVISGDCRKESSEIIKEIISNMSKIPFGKGDLTFSFKQLSQYFDQRGLDRAHYDNLTSFFESSTLTDNILYSLSESIKYLIQKNDETILVAIDNFQDVNVEYLSLFAELLSFFSKNVGHVAFLFLTNTEIIKSESRIYIDAFLKNIDSLFSSDSIFHQLKFTNELSDDDAKLFIMNSIRGLHNEDQLLDTLIQKAGKRPYDLEMSIAYLRDSKKLLEGRDGVFWSINNIDSFREFLKELPNGISSILRERLSLLQRSSTKSEWKAYLFIFKILTLFQGEVPLSVLDYLGVKRKYFNNLVEKSFLRFGSHTENYVAYHDNVLLGIKKFGCFSPDTELAENILSFLDTPYSEMVPNLMLVKFFCAYHASLFKKILDTGVAAIGYYKRLDDHCNIYRIGHPLTKILDQQNYGNTQPQEYVNIYAEYLRSASRYSNYSDATEKFEKIIDFMWLNSNKIDCEIRHSLMHQFVNIYLNSGAARKALSLLKDIEDRGIAVPEYQFLLLNRYCVSHTFLGNVVEGQRYAKAALKKAIELKDLRYMSIAYSDYGHMHLNLTKDIDAAISMFQSGIGIVDNIDNEQDFRKIELRQHEAFCLYLRGKYTEALATAEKALSITKAMNYVYFDIKISILKSTCLIKLGSSDAEGTLIRAKNMCEIFANDRFRWRVLGMLGTYYLIMGKIQAGLQILDLAIELYANFDPKGDLLIKEIPWIANALIGYACEGNNLKQKIILERFHSADLLKINMVLKSIDRSEIQNTNFPMVGIASHGPFALLLS